MKMDIGEREHDYWARRSKYLSSKSASQLLTFFLAFLIITSCYKVFEPFWATNDDVGMSMRAHGYGTCMHGSPNLIFSNVLWGHFVRALPEIHGVLGYSLATVLVLFMVSWSILYFLPRFGTGPLIAFLTLIVVMARPLLFPQFTINSGLLTAMAVIALLAYARDGGRGNLAAFFLFAYTGYLVRQDEFFLLLAVALPCLPWQTISKSRQVQFAILLLGAVIAVSMAVNHQAYSGPEWHHFKALNQARLPFTDFGIAAVLQKRPDIVARHNFSMNDLRLLHDWFYADPKLSAPKALNAMAAEIAPLIPQKERFANGILAIKALTMRHQKLLPLLIGGITLGVLFFRGSLAISWILSLGAIFTTGYIGRAGIFRVYIPLLDFLVLLSFCAIRNDWGQQLTIRRRIAVFILLFTGAWNLFVLSGEQAGTKYVVHQIKSDLKGLPANLPLVTWGQTFPYQLAGTVLDDDNFMRRNHLYSLSMSTYAPSTVAYEEERRGTGVKRRLGLKQGILLLGNPSIFLSHRLEELGVYCREHLGGDLRSALLYKRPSIVVLQEKCIANE